MNRLARLALMTVPLVGCRDIHAPDTTTLDRLEIVTPSRAIAPKEQYTLQLAAYTYSGLPLTPPQVLWSSNNASVATVDGHGVVTGVSLGYAIIKAVGGGMTAATTVQVRPAALRITMQPPVLAVGDTGTISLARLDYKGDVIESENSGAWWDWEENNIVEFLPRSPGQAENQLVVVARTPGRLFIWADGIGASASFWITVVAPAAAR